MNDLSRHRPSLSWWSVATAILSIAGIVAFAVPASAADGARLIVKFKESATKSAVAPKARVEELARITGAPLRHLREMSRGANVVVVDGAGAADAGRIAARLAADPDVEFAEVDHRRHALQSALPVNDLFAPQQRYLGNGATQISAFAAWDVTHGSSNVVVAIVDTGYLPHAGLAGRVLPGYDMISVAAVANDGDGRDPDASDPGDWLTANDLVGIFSDCDVRSSTWHGTSVAGIIGSNTNDGAWTAGIDWAAKLLPVRVLGRCGGYDSDIVDGIAWAAGLSVPGVPINPTPAHVINLSLGAEGSCPAIYSGLADAVYARGVTRAIVAAAGNESDDVANHTPASCPGFYAIASTTGLSGKLAAYSNSGAGITLSAPGGAANFRTPADAVIVLSNNGSMGPTTDAIFNEGGTSFAAPMVSGTIALMLAVAPSLTPDQVHSIVVGTAKPFPATSDCTTDRCGAGIVDAGAAVRAAADLAGGASPNYEGLWWRAPAESEAGWGINLAHQGDIIFMTWFTYDTTGNPWWLSMTANRTASNVFSGDIYETHGPAFSAIPFDPQRVTKAQVGTGTLTFGDNNNGTFAYTVNGVSQSKPITREVFGPLPACVFGAQPNLALATNYQDLWWASPGGSESGWGANFTHQGDTIFITWFTYDFDGAPLWLSAPVYKTSPGQYTGTMYRTTGPAFNAVPFDPQRVVDTEVGTATLTFTNGASGTFAYTVNGVSQARAIEREVFRAPGTVCQ